MSEQENPQQPAESSPPPPDSEGYAQYLLGLFQNPDQYFGDRLQGLRLFALINAGALVFLIALSSFVQRFSATSVSGFRFSWVVHGIKYGLSFAIPLAIVVFVLNWYAKKQGAERSVDFFIEKLGAALALPAVLVLIAIPLNLLGVTMHSWLRSSGLVFIYIAIFMMSYLYAAPRQFKAAVVFTLGFYFAYRLIWLLM